MTDIDPKQYAAVAKAIIDNNAYQAIKYISPKLTLKATRQHKALSRDTRATFVFTMGRPAFREAEQIKRLIKVGEPFPVKKIELRFKVYKKK